MSKQITIEEIKGKKYTVVWQSEAHTSDIASGFQSGDFEEIAEEKDSGVKYLVVHDECILATALPALPRHPKPQNKSIKAICHRYESEGLAVRGRFQALNGIECEDAKFLDFAFQDGDVFEITHARFEGAEIEIAITDEAHNG